MSKTYGLSRCRFCGRSVSVGGLATYNHAMGHYRAIFGKGAEVQAEVRRDPRTWHFYTSRGKVAVAEDAIRAALNAVTAFIRSLAPDA